MAILEAHDLVKYFGNVRAVDHVSLEIREHEILALVGSNGAGKTTLINLLSGYLKPDKGKIIFMGKDITHLPAVTRTRLGIGRSFQIPSLYENITVLDNVRVALLSIEGKTRSLLKPVTLFRDVNKEAMEILETFGLLDKANEFPSELPEGDRKILDVAIAFSLKPRLILLDEPTAGVATKDKFRVMDILVSALRKRGSSALIVEHDMDVVESYADRVAVMHEGRIIAVGKPDDVLSNPTVKSILFGLGGGR